MCDMGSDRLLPSQTVGQGVNGSISLGPRVREGGEGGGAFATPHPTHKSHNRESVNKAKSDAVCIAALLIVNFN